MSGEAMKWARPQKVGSPALKALVNAIAARANRDGMTFVSQATLAADTGMGERTVRRHLVTLEALGVLKRQMRSMGRGGRTSDALTLSMHRSFDVSKSAVKTAKAAPKTVVPTGQCWPPAKYDTPTGQRWPGNRKGITYPIHGEEQTYQGKALGPGGSPNSPKLRVVGGFALDPSFYDDGMIPL